MSAPSSRDGRVAARAAAAAAALKALNGRGDAPPPDRKKSTKKKGKKGSSSRKKASADRRGEHTDSESDSDADMGNAPDSGEDEADERGEGDVGLDTLDQRQLLQVIAGLQRQLKDRKPATKKDSKRPAPPSPRRDGLTPRSALDRRYKGESGATLDDWIAYATQMLAFYSGLSRAAAVIWLATGLEGAALAWYQTSYRLQPPATSDALFAALRSRFQPINSEESTRYELAALKQGPKQSVDDYATRFLHLISLLPEESAASRIFQFRHGLRAAIGDMIRATAEQPATLEKAIALAARLEGRSSAPGAGSDHAANMEVDAGSAILARLAAMEQAIRSNAVDSRDRRHYDSRRERGANRNGRHQPFWMQVPGMTKELADKRFAANQCLHCGSSEHRRRDCKDRMEGKPPRLN